MTHTQDLHILFRHYIVYSMAEYKSFHYLMHAIPETVQAHYVSGPQPLSFEELYSPRDRVILYKGEKSYWRTRDRVEFIIYEDRRFKCMFITCRNIEKSEIYRTIFLKLDVLYYELESKARGCRESLIRKKDKKLDNDSLKKGIIDFILSLD